jgi:hypothetical protein
VAAWGSTEWAATCLPATCCGHACRSTLLAASITRCCTCRMNGQIRQQVSIKVSYNTLQQCFETPVLYVVSTSREEHLASRSDLHWVVPCSSHVAAQRLLPSFGAPHG